MGRHATRTKIRNPGRNETGVSSPFDFRIILKQPNIWPALKKALLYVIKLGLPLALLFYLLASVDRDDYWTFWNQPKRWDLLALAQLAALLAIVISFLRWQRLVTYFEIPFTTTEALRLGFLGHLMNFVSLGSVGGDLFKAILVARQKPSKKPEAVASVLLDRAFGLLGLILLAWLSILFFSDDETPKLVTTIGQAAGAISIVSIVGLLVAVYAGEWFETWIHFIERVVPWAGSPGARMARAVRLLKKSPSSIPILMASSIAVHVMLTYSVYLISRGIYAEAPTMRQHFMVVPPGMAAGALPLAPGGLGVQEGAIVGLFRLLPSLPETYSPVLVAAVFRLATLVIAGIGVVYYVASHGREWKEAQERMKDEG